MEGVRQATAEDVPRLAGLARLAIAELTSSKGGAVWSRREARAEPIDDGLDAAVRSPDHLVLAGTFDGTVVGYAVANVERLRDGSALAVLTELYVEPDARSVGVGEAMIHEVLSWAGKRDCIGVDSLVLPGNREAKNFFESAGLVARAIVVHRPLP